MINFIKEWHTLKFRVRILYYIVNQKVTDKKYEIGLFYSNMTGGRVVYNPYDFSPIFRSPEGELLIYE